MEVMTDEPLLVSMPASIPECNIVDENPPEKPN